MEVSVNLETITTPLEAEEGATSSGCLCWCPLNRDNLLTADREGL